MRRVLFVIGSTLILAITAFAQNATERPLITVTGQAEVRVPPDFVVFTLEVESLDKDMVAAKTKTDNSVKEVLSISRRNEVKTEDVQTSYISVEPKYTTDDIESEVRPRIKREFLGYEVSKTVVVRLTDISKFDALLSDVLKAGVTRVRNVQFRDSQIRKHKDQARAMAIKAAQEKAMALAREIGQSIGPAYSITEGGGSFFDNNSLRQNVSTSISGGLSDEDSAIAPGLISVSAQVLVSFRLQ